MNKKAKFAFKLDIACAQEILKEEVADMSLQLS
jgi:hypothetical protein